MNITSWNVNSLNVRLPHVLQYLQETAPDILGLQELKQTDAAIDRAALAAAGYHPVTPTNRRAPSRRTLVRCAC